jgi:quercetin dioxygenase-like cupin family protein
MITRYTRLYTSDDGETHFDEIERELTVMEFVPGAPPVYLSESLTAHNVSFFGAKDDWKSDWHVSSGRNLFIVLSGKWEVTSSSAETRMFAKGDVLFVEDTTGKGHTSRVVGGEDSIAVLVQIPD